MAKRPSAKLLWKGKAINKQADDAAEAALSIFGLMLESASKKELQPGHGVLTGTLRRSLHAAGIEYEFSQDDREPSRAAPELGGKETKIQKKGQILTLIFGSGMRYSMAVHQGHGSFSGYHFIKEPFDKLKHDFADIYAVEFQKRNKRR